MTPTQIATYIKDQDLQYKLDFLIELKQLVIDQHEQVLKEEQEELDRKKEILHKIQFEKL